MDVLITGAGGTIGGAILEHLADEEAYSLTFSAPHNTDRDVAAGIELEGLKPAAFHGVSHHGRNLVMGVDILSPVL